MPNLTSLAAYNVTVWNLQDKDNEVLSDFDGDHSDLLDFLYDIVNNIKNKTLDQKELQQAICVSQLDRKSRIMEGIIETGQYGHESSIINVKTTDVVYKRKKNDAEMLPFYFYLEVPEGTEDGILILQRTSNFGIRKILHWVLKMAFEAKHPEFKLRFRPLVMQSEIDKYVQGKIRKISFIKKSIPADAVDAYDKGHKEVKGTMELVLRARRGGVLPFNTLISKAFKSKQSKGIFVLEEDQNFAYDNVRAEMKVGRSVRTVNAESPGRLRSYYDITASVKTGPGGHPEYDSIAQEAKKLADNIRSTLFEGGQ